MTLTYIAISRYIHVDVLYNYKILNLKTTCSFFSHLFISSLAFANKLKSAARSDTLPTTTAPSVVSVQQKWTPLSSVVNLPAVLNDPRKVRRETDFFTKTWGEGFVDHGEIPSSPYVPRISRIHFEKYLRQVACVSISL